MAKLLTNKQGKSIDAMFTGALEGHSILERASKKAIKKVKTAKEKRKIKSLAVKAKETSQEQPIFIGGQRVEPNEIRNLFKDNQSSVPKPVKKPRKIKMPKFEAIKRGPIRKVIGGLTRRKS